MCVFAIALHLSEEYVAPLLRSDPIGGSEPDLRCSVTVVTLEPGSTWLADPNRNPGTLGLILFIYILFRFLFQKCRDPNRRLNPKGGFEPEPGLLRRFQLSYQNIFFMLFLFRFFYLRGSIFKWLAHKHLHFIKYNYSEGILCPFKMIYKTKYFFRVRLFVHKISHVQKEMICIWRGIHLYAATCFITLRFLILACLFAYSIPAHR